MSKAVQNFNEARAAGFSPIRAARWADYVARKESRGQQPIALWEAVMQVEEAKK
jgi:hypothetical protein